ARYLTHWGAGEDFPSLGIGHFIWFPAAVDAPFDESFPALATYLAAHENACAPMPGWLAELEPFSAPWPDREAFEAALESEAMLQLRLWLAGTATQQAQYIVDNFSRRWNEIDLPATDYQALTLLLQELMQTSAGRFAVIDYVNFKGLGTNPRERYAGEGWGLVQVLGDIVSERKDGDARRSLIEQFSMATAARLRQRVELAPPERNEARWLAGWMRRVGEYAAVPEESARAQFAGFRVLPYLQNPTSSSMNVIWFSDTATAGELALFSAETNDSTSQITKTTPTVACELGYHARELALIENGRLPTAPFKHVAELRNLQPGTIYRYTVVQNGQQANGEFRTPGTADEPVSFVVYADSETEPESVGKPSAWGGWNDAPGERPYPVDQDTGYRENLRVMADAKPDFIAIAGDLVQSGGEQRDWDEFWRLNATIAASTPIYPALGNHEYFAGPGAFGDYGADASRRAVAKYKRYFTFPDNGAEIDEHRGSYYAVQRGPVSLIVIDGNDGVPHRSDTDTNWYLRDQSQGGVAPAWNPGSKQYAWLEERLREAQQSSEFTFVMFHAAPYSSGVHALPPGMGEGKDYLPGTPLRALTPLFSRFGVDAVFSGHDELYEHSVVPGTEELPDGRREEHAVHFFVVGIGGDGLRGAAREVRNPYRVFSAAVDAPEQYDASGVLVDGGIHYGHLRVTTTQNSAGAWQARLEPVYLFPLLAADGKVQAFEPRNYDDVTLLHGRRNNAANGIAVNSERETDEQ
ncbi:MAG: metallophosphoesterase family protein, partial [Woeseia sp.]